MFKKLKKSGKNGDRLSDNILPKTIKKIGKFKFLYRLNTCDKRQLNHGVDMFFIPEYLQRKDDIIIDVGAHIGTFTIPAAFKSKKGMVYSIEPSKETFEYLTKNVKLNKLKNVRLYNLALTNFKGVTKMYASNKDNWANSIINNKFSKKVETVKTDTLDNFLRENNIKKCDFMKINCEGSEFEIILNATQESLRKINLILILYHCDFNKHHSETELISYLRKTGFSVYVRNKTEKRGWIIAKKRR